MDLIPVFRLEISAPTIRCLQAIVVVSRCTCSETVNACYLAVHFCKPGCAYVTTRCSHLFAASWAHNFLAVQPQLSDNYLHSQRLILSAFILLSILLRRKSTVACKHFPDGRQATQVITTNPGKEEHGCHSPAAILARVVLPPALTKVCRFGWVAAPTWWQCRWATAGRSTGRRRSWRSRCGSAVGAALRVGPAPWWFEPWVLCCSSWSRCRPPRQWSKW